MLVRDTTNWLKMRRAVTTALTMVFVRQYTMHLYLLYRVSVLKWFDFSETWLSLYIQGSVFKLTYQLCSLHLVLIRNSNNSKHKIDEVEATKQNDTKKIQHRPRTHGIQDLRKHIDKGKPMHILLTKSRYWLFDNVTYRDGKCVRMIFLPELRSFRKRTSEFFALLSTTK